MHVRRMTFLMPAVIAALATGAALSLRPGAARALEHQSARISALGGDHVAGVIPDLYTDIGVNPAYAFFAERPTASFARRWNPGFESSLPYLQEDWRRSSSDAMMVDEISAWGIKLSSWRTAVFAQWALDRPQGVTSYPETEMNGGLYMQLREEAYDRTNDFAKIDLTAAREIGDRTALGLRIQARAYSYLDSEMTSRWYEEYSTLPDLSPEREGSEKRLQSYSGRRYSIDLQAGIAKWGDDGPRTDFAINASLNRTNRRWERYDLDIDKEFYPSNEIDSYSYYRYYWSDAREGDIWSFALMFRHAFDGGIRVLAGGNISTCPYETDWTASEERLRWGSWSDVDEKLTGNLEGDGSLLEGNCYVKGSKVFSIHPTTDLYVGLRGAVARIRAEEEPLVHYSIRDGEEASAVQIDQRVRLESIETSFALSLPLSVEFKPSTWFTYFSGVTLWGKWRKVSAPGPIPSLFTFRPPAAVSRAGGARLAGAASAAVVEPAAYTTDWNREFATDASVTLGFSLHYGDRFFVDIYTESDIVPTYLDNNIIDVRYAF